eukprot:GEMP01070529.1.p1 GENE.GEMP01070529.1~~GEMP01070529.1.p1  ORF type:complete len:180 (+),score=36.17 GEMP01070529.1:66-542(+)
MANAADRAHELLTKAHAKATARKAAGYAKAKAAAPPLVPLPPPQVMRSILRRPDLHVHIHVQTRAMEARAAPMAGMPGPPAGFDNIDERLNRNRAIAAAAFTAGAHKQRNLKRRRDEAVSNACTQIADIADHTTNFYAAVSAQMENFMNANGIPEINP